MLQSCVSRMSMLQAPNKSYHVCTDQLGQSLIICTGSHEVPSFADGSKGQELELGLGSSLRLDASFPGRHLKSVSGLLLLRPHSNLDCKIFEELII